MASHVAPCDKTHTDARLVGAHRRHPSQSAAFWMMFIIGIPIEDAESTTSSAAHGHARALGSLVRAAESGPTATASIVMALLMATTVPYASGSWVSATEYWHFLSDRACFIGPGRGLVLCPARPRGAVLQAAPGQPWACAARAMVRPWQFIGAGPVGRWLGRRAARLRGHHAGTRWCCSGSSATATRPHRSRNHVKFSNQLKALQGPEGAQSTANYYSIVFGYVMPVAVDGAIYYDERIRPGHRVAALQPPASPLPAACCISACSPDKNGAHSVWW